MKPLHEALSEISRVFSYAYGLIDYCDNMVHLERFRSKWLGSKGRVKAMLSLLGDVDPKYRSLIARNIEAVKTELTAAHEAKLGEVPEYCG